MRLAIVLTALLASAALAQDNLTEAELPLDHGRLVWTAGSGLRVEYQGQAVFLAPGGVFVLHDTAWTTRFYDSASVASTAKLEEADGRRALVIHHEGEGVAHETRITAGPGDHYTISERFRQDAWDDAALQLAIGKPAEAFWAGARYRGKAGDQGIEGVIPRVFAAATRYPFSGATALEVGSIFGTVHLTSDRGLTLFDYEQRNGAFWLGFDQPVPKGGKVACEVAVDLAEPGFEVQGLKLSGLTCTDTVVDGQLHAGLTVAKVAAGPDELVLRLEATPPGGEPLRVDQPFQPAAQPTPVSAELVLPAAGRYAVTIALLAGEEVVWQSPPANVDAVAALEVAPGRSIYTRETEGSVLAHVHPDVPAGDLRFEATGGGLTLSGTPVPGQVVPMTFNAADLPDGPTQLECRLLSADRVLGTATVTLRKGPAKPNQVVIDALSRGLLCDSLPTIPYGFYTHWAECGLADVETGFGFTHLAPYRYRSFTESDQESVDDVRAVLDRCAAVGMRVHYDIRALATREDSPEKWDHLRQEVEALRDHPALLCWYLADEPELQNIPPERMAAAYKFVKELDPYHPCTMVFARWGDAVKYRDGMDIVMSDPYPIPNGPVTNVTSTTAGILGAFNNLMPLWIVPQAFGGGEWWRREPSAQEGRVMTYLSLIHGATGIQFFIRRQPGVMPHGTQLWATCRQTGSEVNELAPELLGGTRIPLAADLTAIQAAAWRSADSLLVVAANTANRPLAFSLDLQGVGSLLPGAGTQPEAAGGEQKDSRPLLAEVLFENRTLELQGGRIEDMVDGLDTRAYRISLQPGEEDPALTGNLVVNPSFEQMVNVGTPDGYYIGAGDDPSASVRVDARIAYHGRHSLRLTSPGQRGLGMAAFPIPLVKDQRYRVSLMARALQDGVRLTLSVGGLPGSEQTFTLTTDWQEYGLDGVAPEAQRRGQIHYQLTSPGTAWIDLLRLALVDEAPQ